LEPHQPGRGEHLPQHPVGDDVFDVVGHHREPGGDQVRAGMRVAQGAEAARGQHVRGTRPSLRITGPRSAHRWRAATGPCAVSTIARAGTGIGRKVGISEPASELMAYPWILTAPNSL